MSDQYDLNTAGEQRNLEVIPANTLCTLQLTIKPGGVGDDGWLKASKDGNSQGLDCELVVVDGPFAKRKLFKFFVLKGTTPGHAQAGEISRSALRAILESAKGVRADDTSEAAKKARVISAWSDFDQLRFVARLGVDPPRNGYAAKNRIDEVITPEKKDRQPSQQVKTAPTAAATAPTKVAKPQWAQ